MNGYPADASRLFSEPFHIESEQARIKLASEFHDELLAPQQTSLKDNVLNSIANHLVVRPASALTSSVNMLCHSFGTKDLVPMLNEIPVQEQKPFSAQWLAVNTASALADAAVFVGLTLATKHSCRSASIKINESTALIGSGTIYEGLRAPLKDETRLGNASRTLAMLTTFEGGNYLSRKLAGLQLAASRIATGFVAGAGSAAMDSRFSNRSFDDDKILAGGAAGAMMNIIIPAALAGITRFKAPSKHHQTISEKTDLSSSTDIPQPVNHSFERRVSEGSALSKPSPELIGKGQTEVLVSEGIYENGPYSDLTDYARRGMAYGRRPKSLYEVPEYDMTIAVPVSPDAQLTAKGVLSSLEKLPDPSLIKKLVVSDQPHRFEPWIRQEHPEMKILAEAERDGTVILYKPDFNQETHNTLVHEWNHILKFNNRNASEIFDDLHWKEKLETSSASRIHNEHNNEADEVWAILSEDLLGDDPVRMAASAFANPIKSSIWAKTLKDHLNTVLPERQSRKAFVKASDTADFIHKHVRPVAISKLEELHAKNPIFKAVNSALEYLK